MAMVGHGRFCTVINCMDGRTQRPVIEFLEKHFRAAYVDSITEPGPVRVLAERTPGAQFDSILARLRISLEKHGSVGVAVVAHDDCAGNPLPKERQLAQLSAAVGCLRARHPNVPVIGLWLGDDWRPGLMPG
jgi:hypothetical protein